MDTPALSFEGVIKRYAGGVKALDGLSFMIPAGAIAAFVGHNGAGKTTAFSLVGGYLWPDQGTVNILGQGFFSASALKGKLGVLPQDAQLPDRHTAQELLVHLGRLQGLRAAAARQEATRLLELVGLADRGRDLIATLSHGMRRRVAVATALCGSPRLVLLDEPLAGLDPGQAYRLREALAELRGGPTLVVSSHNLAELERLCDWVVMLEHGRCVQQGTMEQVTGQGETVRWELGGTGVAPIDALAQRLPGHAFRMEGTVLVHEAKPGADLDDASVHVMAALAAAGIPVRAMARGVALERKFLEQAKAG